MPQATVVKDRKRGVGAIDDEDAVDMEFVGQEQEAKAAGGSSIASWGTGMIIAGLFALF